jgi:uncharacterized protein (TIGR02444 family)
MPIHETVPFMKLSRPELEADSWAFALELYSRPGVADACLKLQNEAGVDVMMFLMVAFAAVRRRTLLTPSEIRELDEACRPWREQIVRPLRAIRSGLKSGPPPAPNSETEDFRSKVKAIELVSERLQNQLMAEYLPLRPPERDIAGPEDLRSVLRSVVMFFLETRESGKIDDLQASIGAIAEAATLDPR